MMLQKHNSKKVSVQTSRTLIDRTINPSRDVRNHQNKEGIILLAKRGLLSEAPIAYLLYYIGDLSCLPKVKCEEDA